MSALVIKERRAGNVIILDMNGKLNIGENNVTFHNTMRRLLNEDQKQILLNLAGVSYIDSSGLGELTANHFSLNKKGGQLKLLHLTQRHRELMTITKLLTVFDVYESETEAIDSFKGHAEKLEEPQPALV